MAPFVEQHLHDLEFVLVAEDAAVDALFHYRQGVAQHQLVGGQGAVGVARPGLGDDAADAAQLAAVGDDLDFGRQRDQFLQRQGGIAGDAGDAVGEAAADGFAAFDPLRQQDVVKECLGMRQAQAQCAVRGAERSLVLQYAQELAGAVQFRLPFRKQDRPTRACWAR